MRALFLDRTGVRFVDDHPERPQRQEVPVRVVRAGICETDLQLIRGYMGFSGVLGHEFVGVAESGRFAGQRVCGEINCSCGTCETCRAGAGNHCPRRTVVGILGRDGAFAERVWLPERNLHLVPENVSDDEAVFVEPLAAAFQIPAQLDVSQFSTPVVLGDGRLGNLCAQVLAAAGCVPLVVGKHSEKLERIRRLGIEARLLSEMPAERSADLVVDCTGSSRGFPTACRLVRPRGTIVLKTTVAGDRGPSLAPAVIDEITVIGSRCGPFEPALNALRDGLVEVKSLITSRYPLSDGLAALERAGRSDQLKVVLDVVPNA